MTAALVELLDRDGRVRAAVKVDRWPVTIGRAIHNDLVLDDIHLAPDHARLEQREDGGVDLIALPGVNGVRAGRRRLADGERVAVTAAPLALAQFRLRVRLSGEALAPEKPLLASRFPRWTVAAALALWIWQLAAHAVETDPGAKAADWLLPLAGVPFAVVVWAGGWGLASKLFQQRFDFWPHLAVAVSGLLAIELVEFALPALASVSGIALLSRLASPIGAAVLTLMLYGHLRLVLPGMRRVLAALAIGSLLVGGGIAAALNLQRQERLFSELYTTVLPPPALLLARPVPPERFVGELAALKARVDRHARDTDDPAGAPDEE